MKLKNKTMKKKIIILFLVVFVLDSCHSEDKQIYKEIDNRIQKIAKRDGVELKNFEVKRGMIQKTENMYSVIYSKILAIGDTVTIIGQYDSDGYSIVQVNGAYYYLVKNKYEVSKEGILRKRFADNMTTLFGDDSLRIKLSHHQKKIEKEYHFTKSSDFLLNDLKKGNFFYKGKRKDTIFIQFYSPFAEEYYQHDKNLFINRYEKAISIIIRTKSNPNDIMIYPISASLINYDSSY
jgi:hypothetical protein